MLGVAYKTHLSHTYYIIITKDKSIINSCKNTTLPHFLHSKNFILIIFFSNFKITLRMSTNRTNFRSFLTHY